MKIIGEAFIKKAKSLEWKTIGQETVILSTKTMSFYHLNETATFIWKSINRKRRVSEIARKLIDKFDVSKSVVEKDLNKTLSSFSKKGLIEYSKKSTK